MDEIKIARKQSIRMTGLQNARELGGYITADNRRVKKGVLLRSAKLSTASEKDISRLREVYHLEKIADFRSDEEINGSAELSFITGTVSSEPDPAIEGAEYFHMPILDMQSLMQQFSGYDIDPSKGIDQLALLELAVSSGFLGDTLYFGFLDDEAGRRGYSRFFRELLNLSEGRAMLFHCTQGKDRTGVAAMLILSALGVPEDVIVEDYMLTNIYNSERIAAERRMLENSGKIPPDKTDAYLMAMDRVNETTMTNVIAHLKENYGSVNGYIKAELGVTDSELEALREKFLE
ncbi:tyrosine-protein phosphatase [Ruminococcus sp.]|uniref:tyrosine-protein phosphatase n=1 Tax=Ruminococcus sp. TaxID=41978 RepID=UPI0025FACF9E|nr:tyrosine-protein phosphatase [Ruminococcus sp.]MBQ8966644.1 tyrosine-protein phosphatase [Ruminococcus sp.]